MEPVRDPHQIRILPTRRITCSRRLRLNNEAEQVIRMSKLRIKVSGCMRSMHGAEVFCAIRSYLATATRHGISWLDALTQAAAGTPWIPGAT